MEVTLSWCLPGVTILLSLTVFLNMVAETMPATSDAVPLLGTPPQVTGEAEGLKHVQSTVISPLGVILSLLPPLHLPRPLTGGICFRCHRITLANVFP